MTPLPHLLPNPLPRPPGVLAELERVWATPRGWRFLKSVNNTNVGLLYIGTAMLFFLLAGVLGLLIRAQLALPDGQLLSAARYNQIFTMHGTVMMFLFAVPVVEAIAVYLLPPMLGARDLPFPRLSAYAFWAYAVGGLAFFCTLVVGLAPDGGWFMYPPLSGIEYSPGLGADFWLLGIGFIEISAIAGAIELIVGILFTRAPGMTLARMPVFAWAMLVVAFMVVFAFPAVIAGTALLELERAYDWPFFIASRDALLWQHLFWFFGHPEVYIIFLPAAGLVSMMVPALARHRLVGHGAVVAALVFVGVLSFALWAHHMFTAGLGGSALTFVSAASLAIAIPTAVQVFAWIATLWRGNLRMTSAALFILGFLFIFVLGGLTGLMVAVLPFDWQVHDTYFIVAHLHYVLIGGMVFPVIAAIYHWAPLVNRRLLSERLARWSFGLMFGGFNLAFFPMHITGLLGMPRRVATYPADMGWNALNLVSSIGAAVFAAGVAVFVVDALRTLFWAKGTQNDPWRSPTLEWLPNEDYGNRSIAQVDSREPLWDRPALAAEVEAGRHWLPASALGGRETLVTSPGRARLWHVLPLPGDSWLPLVAGFGTAGFFLLLTIKFVLVAWLCAAVTVVAVWAWLWQTDRVPRRLEVEVGTGVVLPVGARGTRSHSWWATVVLIVVDASIFAAFAFAHLHVSIEASVCPPPGSRLPTPAIDGAAVALWLASAALLEWLRRRERFAAGWRAAGRVALTLAAAALAAAGFAVRLLAQLDAGLAPVRDAWNATLAALVGYEGLHALLLVGMALFLAARFGSGRLQPSARATLDNTALWWQASALQAVFGMALVQALPGLLR